jgi:hypothetical protein
MSDPTQRPDRATNTAILEQIGQPPPTSVLATIMQFTSETPDHVAAFVTWGDNETTWRVVASLPAGLLEVTGVKAQRDWHGGRSRDDSCEDDVRACLHPLRALRSAQYKLDRAYRDFDGTVSNVIGVWTLTFESGATLILDGKDVRSQTLEAIDSIVARVLQAPPRSILDRG